MLSTIPGCRFEVDRGPDWLLVKVAELDNSASDPPPLADGVWSLLQQHFTYRVVLELEQVGVMDSWLIGQLVALYKRIRKHDGVMRLCGLSAYNRQVLRTCRLDERFTTYLDRRDAVMAGSAPIRPK